MSTKIYDVFVTYNYDLIYITKLLIQKRKTYLSYVYSHFINQMIKDSVDSYDISKRQSLPETSPYYGLNTFDEFLRKSYSVLLENEKNDIFSPDARLVIGLRPIMYKHYEMLLIAPYGSQELINLFVEDNKDWLIDFEYYNNTDKPDDVSDKEWSERKEVWDIVFDEYWSRKEAMLSYEINNNCSDLPHIGSLFRGCDKSRINIPTDEKRIKKHLRDWYCNEKINEFGKDSVLNNAYTHLGDFQEKYNKGDFDEQKKQITLHPLDGDLIKFLKDEA